MNYFKKVETEDYNKMKSLIKSKNELSVMAVLSNIMPGEVYADNTDNASVVLIKTSECNYIAGQTNITEFNQNIKSVIDFWDPITPDTLEWNKLIPAIHQDKFIRNYTRRHYVLRRDDKQKDFDLSLPEGFYLEQVNLELLRKSDYENTQNLIEWAENWGNDEQFIKYGLGFYIRNDKTIVSWSLNDCCHDLNIAIGIHTDERYRKNGLAKKVIAQMIKTIFAQGYDEIEWLCVDSNKGSIALAEHMGFNLRNKYDCFTPYPPIENVRDLMECEWKEWADYLYESAVDEPQLYTECLVSYMKANHPEKSEEVIDIMKQKDIKINIDMNGFIKYLHKHDMAGNFDKDWMSR